MKPNRQSGLLKYRSSSSYVISGKIEAGFEQRGVVSCKVCAQAETLATSTNKLVTRLALVRIAGLSERHGITEARSANRPILGVGFSVTLMTVPARKFLTLGMATCCLRYLSTLDETKSSLLSSFLYLLNCYLHSNSPATLPRDGTEPPC